MKTLGQGTYFLFEMNNWCLSSLLFTEPYWSSGAIAAIRQNTVAFEKMNDIGKFLFRN